MTERLYNDDGMLRAFDARVEDCVPRGDCWAVILDRTAFFPGGGGQEPDCGFLGGAKVVTCLEEGGELLHITDSPLTAGETSITFSFLMTH